VRASTPRQQEIRQQRVRQQQTRQEQTRQQQARQQQARQQQARGRRAGFGGLVLMGTLAASLPGCSAGGVPSAPAAPTTTAVTTTSTVPTTVAPSATTQADIAYDTNAAASYAVGPEPANWDIHSAGASAWYLTLEQVLAQVWPSAFTVGTNGTPSLNTSLLTSAAEVSTSPQRVVYQVNPLAVWSNGVPITYRDFVYNWQAQSGHAAYRDVGGTRFTPVDETGYRDVASVTGTAAEPRTVTVTFSSPDPDWRSLFSYLMPAQVGRSVGFDSGFKDPVADLLSGGPYLVSELQNGFSLELVRNARYWGSPANLSAITYYFTSGTAETVNALSAGEVDLATVEAEPGAFKQLQAASGLSVRATASNFYEDLDMNEIGGPLSAPLLRRAIMMALDRATMATELLTPYGIAATPVENRVFLPGSPGYTDDGPGYDQPAPAAAIRLLTANGYTLSGGALDSPSGRPVNLSLLVEAADPVAQQLADEVVSACAAIGVTVSIVQTGAPGSDLLEAATAPSLPAKWQLAIELRRVPTFPSGIASRYAGGGGANQDGYSNASMNALLGQMTTAPPARLPALYGEVDELAWKDYVDLPLVPLPVVVAANSKLLNLTVGPYLGDIAWNEEDWGFLAS
jgi:peptide/nickel transport system substrate-binding protein